MSKKLLFNFNREVIQNYTYVKYVGTIITATNTLEKPIKSASLKGSTKYRDIDTGEILEAFEEGRNLELVSVRMPVLKTIGKNLFDASKWINGRPAPHTNSSINQIQNIQSSATPIIECKPNTTYTISRILPDNSTTNWYALYGYNKDGFKVQHIVDTQHVGKKTFTTNNDVYYLRGKSDNPYEIGKNELWQIEEGSTATTYEPYKSNILTVNEDVTLRGIGDVRDELDLLTGEVTKRIEEIVLDGSEEGWIYTNKGSTAIGYIESYFTTPPTNAITNYFSLIENRPEVFWSAGLDYEMFCVNDKSLAFRIEKSKLKTLDSNGIKEWLSQNNLIIQYDLATPIIKTVDLSILDQNENKVSSISSFNDTTHITASSETIPPIFEGYLATKEVE